ncbi:MAG: undecaprenyl/decaprenyl-phosphate alpha-N-acetylglucosaminyl 1-phosphate transferase [Taibaiella sp.]|nr:undecaprenyl/decaprenyl-phosphate alpha-N-acetylglucosaminyl 1-phosphate transferase [Taibaiella sp.]
MHLYPPLIYILSFIAALVACLILTPGVIYVARQRKLFDLPDDTRKKHISNTPQLGGIAIFLSYIIIASLFIAPPISSKWNYIIASTTILFLTGLSDDVFNMSAFKKLLLQLLATAITVWLADIRLTSLYGFAGIYTLSYPVSIGITILYISFIINVFNLTDGIDGLAASFGILAVVLCGVCFVLLHYIPAACVAFSLAGALCGFLRYNIAPASIFMGDTGSLLIGFTISILSILMLNVYSADMPLGHVIHTPGAAFILALSFIFIPIADAIRVFAGRLLRGISPFRADRSHLHYYLLDMGLTQSKSVLLMLFVNLGIIAAAYLLQDSNIHIALAVMAGISALFFFIIGMLKNQKKHKA